MLELLLVATIFFGLGWVAKAATLGPLEVQHGRRKVVLTRTGVAVFEMHPRGTQERPGWAQKWPRR